MTVLYSSQGDISLASGQALTVQRTFSDATTGAPVDLTGRSFTLTVFARDGSITPIAVDAIVSGPVASMTLTSAMTTTLHAANDAGKALGWQIVEHLAGGLTGFVFGPRGFAVTASGGVSAGVQSQTVAGAPVVQISGADGGGTIRIDSFGAPGDSAGAQVKRARPTEIVDASDGAFATWAQKPALDAAGVATAAAGTATAKAALADTAATNANQKAAAAQAVVDQQTTTLGQVAQAKTDAQAARDAASGSATATAADRVQTGQDRSATGQAKVDAQAARDAAAASATATTGDRTQTGLDRTATGGDRVQTGLDRAATGTAVTATAADRVQTGQDRTATGADRTQTALDRVSTTASAGAAATSAGAAASSALTVQQSIGTAQQLLQASTDRLTYLTQQINIGDTSGTVTLDIAQAYSFRTRAIGNILMAEPLHYNDGDTWQLFATQDIVGSRAMTFASVYRPRSGFALSLTPSATDILFFTAVAGTIVVDINKSDSPFGAMASKSPGVSLLDVGSGVVEAMAPLQTALGPTFDMTAGLFRYTRRANSSGTATMNDTLPDVRTIGQGRIKTKNVDAVASIIVTPFAGHTVGGGGSVTIAAGQTAEFLWSQAQLDWVVDGLSGLVSSGVQTWAPALSFASNGDLSVSYSTQLGRYMKVGSKVDVQIELVCVPTYTTASSSARISLPLTSSTGMNQNIGIHDFGTSTTTAWPSSVTEPAGRVPSGSAYLSIYGARPAGQITFATSNIPSGSTFTLRAAGTYFTP